MSGGLSVLILLIIVFMGCELGFLFSHVQLQLVDESIRSPRWLILHGKYNKVGKMHRLVTATCLIYFLRLSPRSFSSVRNESSPRRNYAISITKFRLVPAYIVLHLKQNMPSK